MRVGFSNGLGLRGAVLLSVALALSVGAKDKTPNTTSLEGKVFMIDPATSAIMVDTKSGVRRLVVYGPDTKFKYGRGGKSKESSIDQVKESDSISCTGTTDDKARLVAKECVHRESK